MQKVIENYQLNEYLKMVIDDYKPHENEFKEILEVLYKTGLRSEEVIDMSRWEVIKDGIYSVKTCKNSNIREFKSVDLNEIFESEIIRKTGRYFLINYGSLNYSFQKHMYGERFFVGNKSIYLHLFRYNFIRQLSEKGKTFNEIVAIMGHKEKQNTADYLTNKICIR